ncbi:hypothetical protein AYI69_g6658 [Smittium culicis]|uniref:Uncharacterized protein n=1 Tax=Smittium culicis TaxID=133412 RepID=A0A1R1XXD6_9FUNG|nr:hypothetical protein AYI69_g6658 [Smittium culicis]
MPATRHGGVVFGSNFYSGLLSQSQVLMHINAKGLLTIFLLRQHNDLDIRQEISWYNIPISAQHSRRYIASLFEHKYQTVSDVCTIYDEPGGCPKSVDSSKGVAAFPESIHNSEPELVPRQEIDMPELIDVQMVEMVQSILLSPVKYDRSDTPEGQKRTFNNNISNTVVGIGNLVPRST